MQSRFLNSRIPLISMPCFQEGLFKVLNLKKYTVLLGKPIKFCRIQCFLFHLVSEDHYFCLPVTKQNEVKFLTFVRSYVTPKGQKL